MQLYAGSDRTPSAAATPPAHLVSFSPFIFFSNPFCVSINASRNEGISRSTMTGSRANEAVPARQLLHNAPMNLR